MDAGAESGPRTEGDNERVILWRGCLIVVGLSGKDGNETVMGA